MGRLWIVVLLIGTLSAPAFGQSGWGRIIRGGPFEQFRGADWDMFRANVTHAADAPADADPASWSNARTGARGDVKVARRFDSPDFGECREMQGTNTARGRTGPFTVTLCRKAGGAWKIK